MSNAKLNALQDLIDTPKNLYKLKVYERKLHDANIVLLFDCRTIIMNSVKSSNQNAELLRITQQLKLRIDSLIDQSRMLELRIRPGISDKQRKIIFDNAVIFDLIIFSRCWDLKSFLSDLDSQILFEAQEELKEKVKDILEYIQVIDNLFSQKQNVAINVQSSEEVVRSLIEYFNKELDFADRAGALKGIIKLDKPKIIGKGRYYDQLGNLILKIILSFELKNASDPIALRDIYTRFIREYPNVSADFKDIQKVVEELNENGLLILGEDRKGLLFVRLQPAEAEMNIILDLAKEKGFITVEELVMITNLSIEEALEEMNRFVKAGIAIRDIDYAEGTKYYFPGLSDS